MKQKNLDYILICIGIVANLLAVSSLDYSFYQILRVYNFILFSILAYGYYRNNQRISFLVSLFFLIISNPVEKVSFDKDTWIFFNVLASSFLGFTIFGLGKLKKLITAPPLTSYQEEIQRLKK
jgi:hypothetical protein